MESIKTDVTHIGHLSESDKLYFSTLEEAVFLYSFLDTSLFQLLLKLKLFQSDRLNLMDT